MRTKSLTLTRQSILDASITLMQRRGYRSVGMRDIAEQLTIKAASLYHHFPSKEALAAEAMQRYREVQLERLERLSRRRSLEGRLKAYAELFAEMVEDDHRLCLYLVLSAAQPLLESPCLAQLAKFSEQNVAWLEATLKTCPAPASAGTSMNPRELAEVIFGAFEGFMVVATTEGDPAGGFRRRARGLLRSLRLVKIQSAPTI